MCPMASGAVTSASGRPAARSRTTGSLMHRSGKALSAFLRRVNRTSRPPIRSDAMGGMGGVRVISPFIRALSRKLWNLRHRPTVELSMKNSKSLFMGACLLAAGLTGCDQLGGAKMALGPPEVPADAAIKKISYMTAENTGPQGRKSYNHLWQAKTCEDFETAMRWNRPPNVPGGSFGKQMVYLTDTVPADLREDSEDFIRGTIE